MCFIKERKKKKSLTNGSVAPSDLEKANDANKMTVTSDLHTDWPANGAYVNHGACDLHLQTKVDDLDAESVKTTRF